MKAEKKRINVSVIIPAYNCEKIIPETIKSVINQKLENIEIIILNDGSTDKTLQVVEALTKDDPRVRIFTLKNGGPAKARNAGINNALGEYLYFLDADDIIHEDMLFDMYNMCSLNSLDVCACGYQMESIISKRVSIREFTYKDFIATNKEDFRSELMPLIKSHLMYVVWNKMFNRMFIMENHIEFTDFLSGEDRLFNIATFKRINKFGFINKIYYRYFIRGKSSLANKYISNRFQATLKSHLDLTKAYKDMNIYTEQNKAYIEFVFIKGIMSCFCQMFIKGCPLNRKQKLKYIKTTIEMPWVKDAIQSYDEEFYYSKAVNKILRSGKLKLIYYTAYLIYFGQTNLNGLYQSIKHKQRK